MFVRIWIAPPKLMILVLSSSLLWLSINSRSAVRALCRNVFLPNFAELIWSDVDRLLPEPRKQTTLINQRISRYVVEPGRHSDCFGLIYDC